MEDERCAEETGTSIYLVIKEMLKKEECMRNTHKPLPDKFFWSVILQKEIEPLKRVQGEQKESVLLELYFQSSDFQWLEWG